MILTYNSLEEFNELIKNINIKYYDRLNANILFIEEISDKIFVVYIIELRDAYSHLIRIFDHDILSVEGKKNALFHLENYVNHLRRGLLDTFRKILAIEFKYLQKSVHKNDVQSINHQIAQKAHALRIMGKGVLDDERIDGYIELLDNMSEIRKKLAI
jgi:hypothetical protein